VVVKEAVEEGTIATISISTRHHYILNWRNFNNSILLLFNKLDLGGLLINLDKDKVKDKDKCTVDSLDLMVNKLDIMEDHTLMFNLPMLRLHQVIPKMMIRP